MDRVTAAREAAEMAAKITGHSSDPEPKKETGHFYVCSKCSQLVDMRYLGEVLHHEVPGHKPLSAN